MIEPAAARARLTPGQTVGWALAFLVVAALIVMFFAMGTFARPLFEAGAVTEAAWPRS